MRKIHYLLMTAVAALVAFTGCHKEPEQQTDANSVGKFSLSQIVDAAAAAFSTWEAEEAMPETFKVGDKDLTLPQYQNAICQALVSISSGKTGEIDVKSYKPADHPERDSYDKESILIAGGPKNGEETEDLVNVATRMLSRMESDLKVPNQTNFTRNGSAIAFSTDRATIVISRVLAQYKSEGKLPASVDAGYKGASNTLKAFAKELVKYLDVWEKTVGTVDADGSHCTSNNSAWKNVHFIPIEYSGGYKDGTMYTDQYMPYYHPVVDGKEYTAAECWTIAAQGIMDLVTKEGSALMQPTRNPFIHTMGNGKSLNEPMPAPTEYSTVTGFNAYPWYENTSDGPIINFSETLPCTIEFVAHALGWYLTRNTLFDTPAIGNFQQFGKGEGVINFGDYAGTIATMRMFLIMIRFYDYLLKNNIEENVWDATKDLAINYDLYGVDMPDITLDTKKLDFDCEEQTREAKFTAKKAWTATASESWITVDPSSGEAGDITIKITCAPNQGDAREGKVIIKGGNVTEGLEIAISQVKYTEPSTATIKEFAQEYIKIIDEWATHVGTINRLSDWELAKEGDNDIVENAHYVPNGYTILVGGKTYTTGDMLELALRSYLLLRGWDGNETEKAGWGNFAATTPVDINAPLPKAHDFVFGSPLIETSNGGYLAKIVNGEKVYGQVDPVILDNWAQRALNWPFTHNKVHSNLCGYPKPEHDINNYDGCFSSGRALLTYAFFFKYMLENGLEKADNLGADVVIRSELFGIETATETQYTIKDFAQEYVKIINIWQNNVGTINRLSDWELAKTGDNDVVENAHYIPHGTTIMLGNRVYTTGDMLELALRSYLLLRGWDGNETEKAGWGNFPSINPVDINAPLPEAHDFVFGSPLIETSNGGYLAKIVNGEKVYGQVDPVILDNWAQRALNWPFTHDKVHSNLCGYPKPEHNINNYDGCFSSGRALLTYAFFFKYMLDNGLQKADALGADVVIRSELFGLETANTPTLKDFAKEFVKGLDVWQNTVGNVDADGVRNQNSNLGGWQNVHFIPIVGRTDGEFYKLGNNQYDPKYTPWTLKIAGKEYSSSQAWEIAIRGLLNMVTAEGEEFLNTMDDRNKAYTLQDNMALSKAPISATSPDNQWGKNPWYEYGNLVRDANGNELTEVDVNFMVKVGAWHVVRSFIAVGSNSPLGMIGNFQEFGADSGKLNLNGYVGYISPMRELLVMMRIYKYLLDNNIDSNVYSAIKDRKFDFDLYGQSPAPAASIKIDGDLSDWDAIDAQAGTGDRITEWKITSDADNIYLYFKVPNSVAKSRGKWNAYLVAAFDTDNNSATGSDAGYGLGSDYEALTVTFPFSNASGEDPVLANEAISDSKIECPIGTKVDTLGSMGKVSGDSSLIEYSIPRAKIGSPASGSTIGVRVGMASQSIPEKVQITLN